MEKGILENGVSAIKVSKQRKEYGEKRVIISAYSNEEGRRCGRDIRPQAQNQENKATFRQLKGFDVFGFKK